MSDNRSGRLYGWAGFWAVAAMGALALDMSVARYVSLIGMPGDVRKLFSVSEVFAHGFGVALILLTVAVLDPRKRYRLPRVMWCAFGAGLGAQLAKNFFPRLRPQVCDLTCTAWQTFVGSGATAYAHTQQLATRDIQSFPSGHSATAVGLAIGLAWLYPRGRWLFALFAVLAMAQRLESTAHFLSDTLAGAALACLLAAVSWDNRALHGWFTRLERRMSSEPPPLELIPQEQLRQRAA